MTEIEKYVEKNLKGAISYIVERLEDSNGGIEIETAHEIIENLLCHYRFDFEEDFLPETEQLLDNVRANLPFYLKY